MCYKGKIWSQAIGFRKVQEQQFSRCFALCDFSSNFKDHYRNQTVSIYITPFRIRQRLQVPSSCIGAVALSQVNTRPESHSRSLQRLRCLFNTRWLYQGMSTLSYSILPTRNHDSQPIDSYYFPQKHIKLRNSSTTTYHLLTITVQILTTHPRNDGGNSPRYGSSRGRDVAGWAR